MDLITSFKRVLVSVLLIGFFALFPLRASAIFVPIFDQATLSLEIKEYGLDWAAKLAANALQQVVIGTLTDWVLSGFDGNPSFVVNPRDLVSRVEENAAGVFQLQLANSNVCEPYRAGVNRAVAQAALDRGDGAQNREAEVIRVTGCNLDDLVASGNIENYFTSGGFSEQGGYAPFLQMLTSPKDHPLEAPAIAVALQRQRQAEATREAKEEVDRGQGFESLKECVEGNVGACLRYEVNTPGKNVGELLDKALAQSFDQLAAADELSEIVIGFISALTSQAINGLR